MKMIYLRNTQICITVYNQIKGNEIYKMKIVHIAPNSPYNDYWGYQDNLLPKYHKRAGHEVTLIITNKTHKDGQIVEVPCADYVLNDGVRVIRRGYRQYNFPKLTNFLIYMPVYDLLEEIKPDFIFYHGLISYSIFDAVKYMKKNPECVLVEDNHMDYYNVPDVNLLNRKIRMIWRRFINKRSIKYVSKVYGVTPWRKTYAEDYFKIPENKTAVLVMGGDDDCIHFDRMPELRDQIRDKLNIRHDDFVIVTGGKIDKTKNIHLLIQAVSKINRDNVKLIVFGQPDAEMKEIIENLCMDKHIRNIGWIDSVKVYDYFLASDLVIFPGTHSVLWEQAAACGVPMFVKDWEGMHHIDAGGNCEFLTEDDPEEMKVKIIELIDCPEKYEKMRSAAVEKAIPMFSYSEIAKRAIELK